MYLSYKVTFMGQPMEEPVLYLSHTGLLVVYRTLGVKITRWSRDLNQGIYPSECGIRIEVLGSGSGYSYSALGSILVGKEQP